MKKYPAYKDSDVEWIGQVPIYWVNRRVKSFIDYTVNGVWGDEPINDQNDIICVRVADFNMSTLGINKEDFTYRNISESQQKNRLLSKSDILIEKSGGGEKQPVGRSINADIDKKAVCSNFIGRIVLKDNEVFPRYSEYLLTALYINGLNQKAIKQTTGIQNLDTDLYFNERIFLPSKNEQKAIATYLDRKTTQIDDLIAKKERMIKLLKEERTAIINQAVTKGLDPNVEMKDSGIEWLGKIPKHWEVKKLKFNVLVRFSNVDKKSEKGEASVKLCNYVDVYYNNFITLDLNFMEATASLEEIHKFQLNIGDVILTKDSESWEDIAIPAYVSETEDKLICGYHLAQISPNSEVLSGKFLFWMLSGNAFNYQFRIEATGITRYSLSNYGLSNSLIVLPPINEQDAISAYLDKKTKQIYDRMKQEKKSIELLKEYRTALISEVVTGKIDVRGVVNG